LEERDARIKQLESVLNKLQEREARVESAAKKAAKDRIYELEQKLAALLAAPPSPVKPSVKKPKDCTIIKLPRKIKQKKMLWQNKRQHYLIYLIKYLRLEILREEVLQHSL
jgi:hypothetical protein